MAIVRVQGNIRGTAYNGNVTVTLTSTPISGNVLVATTAVYDTETIKTCSSITETNVVWTKQISRTFAKGQIGIWFGVVSASASTTVTIAFSGYEFTRAVVDICEYSGILTASFLDKSASSYGGPTTPAVTGTTANTTQNDELWVGAIGCYSYAQSTPAGGFTLLDGALYTSISNGYLELIVSATGAAASGTTPTSATLYGGCIATFFASAAAGGAAVQKRRLLLGVGLQVDVWNLNKHKLKFPRLTPKTF
jgi:hypothetical protein